MGDTVQYRRWGSALRWYAAPIRELSEMSSVITTGLVWFVGIGGAVFLPLPLPIRALLAALGAVWLGVFGIFRLMTDTADTRLLLIRALAALSIECSSTATNHRSLKADRAYLESLNEVRGIFEEKLTGETKELVIESLRPEVARLEVETTRAVRSSTDLLRQVTDYLLPVMGSAAVARVLAAPDEASEEAQLDRYASALDALCDEVRRDIWETEISRQAVRTTSTNPRSRLAGFA